MKIVESLDMTAKKFLQIQTQHIFIQTTKVMQSCVIGRRDGILSILIFQFCLFVFLLKVYGIKGAPLRPL